MIESRYMGNGHPTFNRNPYMAINPYYIPYYWVDDQPPSFGGNTGSLDPSTYQNHRTLGRLPPETCWSLGNQNRNPSPGPLSFTVSKTTCNNPWWSFSWWHKFPFHASQTIGKKNTVSFILSRWFSHNFGPLKTFMVHSFGGPKVVT